MILWCMILCIFFIFTTSLHEVLCDISLSISDDMVDINLGKKHGLNSTTQLSQDALLKIINGAERGDRGMCYWNINDHLLVQLITNKYESWLDNLYFLGLLKLYGITVSKDYVVAAQNFQKAANLGLADAQTAFGVMKMKGIGGM